MNFLSDKPAVAASFLVAFILTQGVIIYAVSKPGPPGPPGPQGPQGIQGAPGSDGMNGKDGTSYEETQYHADATGFNRVYIDNEFSVGKRSTFGGEAEFAKGIVSKGESNRFTGKVSINHLDVTKCSGCVPSGTCFDQSDCEVSCLRMNARSVFTEQLHVSGSHSGVHIAGENVKLASNHGIHLNSKMYIEFNSSALVFTNQTRVVGDLLFDRVMCEYRPAPVADPNANPETTQLTSIAFPQPPLPTYDFISMLSRVDVWYNRKTKKYDFDFAKLSDEEFALLFPNGNRRAFDLTQIIAVVIEGLKDLIEYNARK